MKRRVISEMISPSRRANILLRLYALPSSFHKTYSSGLIYFSMRCAVALNGFDLFCVCFFLLLNGLSYVFYDVFSYIVGSTS